MWIPILLHKIKRSQQHDTSCNKADSQREKKDESETPVSKQSKQSGSACNNPNSSGALIVASTTSKKPGPRNEGASASPASALSKLTNPLNFLKERRAQIANELLDVDRSLNYCQISLSPERKRLDRPPENSSSEKK
ncbi:hypothetical protein DM860_006688 [Cuscuta australis]|uniref:Uncharacterized protein n=1 Tax=Cuscuta australis TaxID=267555 RepID=A0A328D818_9ASTE|nr:hypothetical protein DM860_006688 [Cuscuta australis]